MRLLVRFAPRIWAAVLPLDRIIELGAGDGRKLAALLSGRPRGLKAQRVDLVQVIVGKFPLFVLGFIVMFLLSSTGIFAPARHYQGAYFDNSDEALVRKDRASGKEVNNYLKDKDVAVLKTEADKIKRDDQRAALERLIENKKLMSIEDDDTLRGVVNAKILSKEASAVLTRAHRAVRHTAPKIAMFRELIAWFFTFGLVDGFEREGFDRFAESLARPEMRGLKIRLLGVGTSNFDRPTQMGLFEAGEERRGAGQGLLTLCVSVGQPVTSHPSKGS